MSTCIYCDEEIKPEDVFKDTCGEYHKSCAAHVGYEVEEDEVHVDRVGDDTDNTPLVDEDRLEYLLY
ncbi:hypothetical protein [Vibrio phage Va2]|nr:hypothetical protein [Vibrio phage Va2]